MIACLGNIVADILIKPFEEIPASGVLRVVDRIQLGLGGCAGNAAAVLGRMGAEVSLLCGIGGDGLSRFLLDELRLAGVGLQGVKIFSDTVSSASIVCIDRSGERSFLTQFGASKRYGVEDVNWKVLSRAKHLHYGGFFTVPGIVGDAAASVFQRAKEMGKMTSLDTAFDHSGKWMEAIEAALPFVDYLMTNRVEGRHLTGEQTPEGIVRRLRERGARTIVVKLDKDGCFLDGGDMVAAVPAYPVEVVDATGAGDAFAAGFITGLDRGIGVDDCCRLGNLFGAVCVQRLGTTEAFTSKQDVMRFIGEREPGLSEELKDLHMARERLSDERLTPSQLRKAVRSL